MKKLLFLGACLVALASQPARAQTAQAEVVVVRMQFDGVPRPYAAIARGGATPEFIREEKGADDTAFYQQILAKLYQEGYSLKSTVASNDLRVSVLVFDKRK